jgi:hypothetical protein
LRGLYATGAVQIIAVPFRDGTFCADYDGRSYALGGSYAPIDGRVGYLAVGTSVGSFFRFCGKDHHLTASLDVAGELTLLGPFRLLLRASHRQIFDRAYERTQGGYPRFNSLAVGLGIFTPR